MVQHFQGRQPFILTPFTMGYGGGLWGKGGKSV